MRSAARKRRVAPKHQPNVGADTMDIAQQDLWIRERAYWLWEEEGRPEGRELDHWYRASREIAGRAAAIPAHPEAASVSQKAKSRKTAANGRTRKTLQ
jgi:hypothetical protein